jgi:prepilin-type N-terminal cleavage/methylation domain-containing protein
MIHKEHGFTLIEIVVVMVLISIVAATVFTRSITTDAINLRSRAEKVQNHIRYAQSMAMKTGDVWGIFSSSPQYWLFEGYLPEEVTDAQLLPGEDTEQIILTGSGINLNNFLLYFDEMGKPYKTYNSPTVNVPVTAAAPLTITITSEEDGSIQRKLSITPETGLIVVTE